MVRPLWRTGMHSTRTRSRIDGTVISPSMISSTPHRPGHQGPVARRRARRSGRGGRASGWWRAARGPPPQNSSPRRRRAARVGSIAERHEQQQVREAEVGEHVPRRHEALEVHQSPPPRDGTACGRSRRAMPRSDGRAVRPVPGSCVDAMVSMDAAQRRSLAGGVPRAPGLPFQVTRVRRRRRGAGLAGAESVQLRPGNTISGPTLMTLADTVAYVAPSCRGSDSSSSRSRAASRSTSSESLLPPTSEPPANCSSSGRRQAVVSIRPARGPQHLHLHRHDGVEEDLRPSPGEDPAAEDLGRIELVNSSGMQNTVRQAGPPPGPHHLGPRMSLLRRQRRVWWPSTPRRSLRPAEHAHRAPRPTCRADEGPGVSPSIESSTNERSGQRQIWSPSCEQAGEVVRCRRRSRARRPPRRGCGPGWRAARPLAWRPPGS
jgi:acyl-coenzyme A thioesterase PaaI-like protein